jgi:hypothetical protein
MSPLPGARAARYSPGTLGILVLLACCSAATSAAGQLSGSVRNQSRNQSAVGDDVILIRLDAGMPEEARAKTDDQGAFSLRVPHPDKPYLVRVIHQGVAYDQKASAGDTVSIQVFDAAPRVFGVTGTIEILRSGTKGNLLHVSDMYEIRNTSDPPLTQASERTFDVFLPPQAKIDSVLAAGPGEMALMISAAFVTGDPGHYTVNFPLRPGATKFAFNYDLPYNGHAAFRTRHAYPLQQFAVMIPSTMKFSSLSPAFKTLPTGNTRYLVQAVSQLQAGEGPAFEIAGSGELPPIGDQAKSRPKSLAPTALAPLPPPVPRPSLASVDPRFAQPQISSPSIVLAETVAAFFLAACCLLIWRVRRARRIPRSTTDLTWACAAPRSSNLSAALQRELSQLEADRCRGCISEQEYASTKQAIDAMLRRVVNP